MTSLIEHFKRDLILRRRSERTISSYVCNVREFLIHYPEPHVLESDDLEDYLAILLDRNLQSNTLKSIFSSISAFYDYLIHRGIVNNNPIVPFRKRYLDNIDTDSSRRQIPDISDVHTLIKQVTQIRERTIILTLAKTGIRRTELLSLKPSDIDLKHNTIQVVRQKRAKNRIKFIDEELRCTLEQYLLWRTERCMLGKCKTPYLWISDTGGRMHKDYVNLFIQKYAEQIGLHTPGGKLDEQLSTHCFRGFLVTYLRRSGMQKEYIQILLGHSINDEVWSGHYLDIDLELVRKEYLRCVPKLL